MATYAKLRTPAVVFEASPTPINDVNALYIDANTSELKQKLPDEQPPVPVSSGVSLFVKQKQSSGAIPPNTPVSLLATGRIVPTDSDAAGQQDPIGFTLSDFPSDGSLGDVILTGANADGILVGSGFAPGDEIYMTPTPGVLTNNPATVPVESNSLIKLGIADCAAGAASATVADLILALQVIVRP